MHHKPKKKPPIALILFSFKKQTTLTIIIMSWTSGNRIAKSLLQAGAVTLTATSAISNQSSSKCEEGRFFRLFRKRRTLQQADKDSTTQTLRRYNTKEELSKIRVNEVEMLRRWEKDEDGWRELPARAWPAYQPKPDELEGIESDASKNKCSSSGKKNMICTQLLFNIATTLVFYNIDAERGFRQYEELAKQGHIDSMVAVGIMLVEGLGIKPQEEKGIEWLKKAVELDSSQGCYELGTVFYTGIDGILEEDPKAAFELFQKAAKQDHVAGTYMMADCLIEGEGTEQSVAKAVPLFYQAAERGHRFSRQRIRELLARKEYQS